MPETVQNHAADVTKLDVTKLIDAVKKGETATVQELLERQPALAAARDENNVSAVMLAVYYGHSGVARLFVERGAELDIFEACAIGDTDRARRLLEDDPSLANAVALDGHRPLGLACYFGHGELARMLLALGADVNAASRNAMSVTPLHAAVARRDVEIVRVLLDAGADVNARQQARYTALHSAAAAGDRALAEMLVARGADVDAQSEDGKTAAGLAAEKGHHALAEWLAAASASRARKSTL